MITAAHQPDTRIPRRLALSAVLAALALAAGASPVDATISPMEEPAAGSPRTIAGDDEPGVWSWPVSPVPEVTRPFEFPDPYGPGHRGIDLAVPAGAPVLAPDDGTVHFAGWVVDRPVMSIRHPNGLISSFEPVDAVVEVGDAVVRGQTIATVAAEPAHEPSGGLHLGARADGEYVDPLSLLGGAPRAVLLPLAG